MKFGEYDIKLNPLGWLALAAAAAANVVAPGRGFRREGKTSMAWANHVYIINPDDECVYVEHIFYGDTKAEAETVKQKHLGSCEYFKAAQNEGRTDEWWDEIPVEDLPSVEGADEEEK